MPLSRDATERALWTDLFADRTWRQWALAAFLARLPITSTIIAFATAGQALTGDAGDGVVLGSAAGFLAALAGPSAGRLADRFGPRLLLAVAAAVITLAAAGAGVAVLANAPLVALAVAAVAHGLGLAPVQGCLRATLLGAVPPPRMAAATTAEAVLIEATFIAGPGVAALVGTTGGAAALLFAISACAATVVVLCLRIPQSDMMDPPLATVVTPWSMLFNMRGVLAVTFVGGLALGVMQSSAPALAERAGASAAAGGYLHALVATGALLGGLAAARSGRLHPSGIPRLLGWAAAGLLVVALPLPMPVLAASLLAAGAPIAPLNALGMAAAATRGTGHQAEAGASYFAALAMGAGVGGLLSGVALGLSTPGPVLVAAAVTIAGLATAVRLGRRPVTVRG